METVTSGPATGLVVQNDLLCTGQAFESVEQKSPAVPDVSASEPSPAVVMSQTATTETCQSQSPQMIPCLTTQRPPSSGAMIAHVPIVPNAQVPVVPSAQVPVLPSALPMSYSNKFPKKKVVPSVRYLYHPFMPMVCTQSMGILLKRRY